MPNITAITAQKRRENRRNVFLDGQFAFGCSVNVIARFRLREGMAISDEQVKEIQLGVVKQECFDKAMRFLEMRLHSRRELEQKLKRQEWGDAVIATVLDDLSRMNYLDDARFATVKAKSLAEHKKHGRRRAKVELLRAGVQSSVADAALGTVYDSHDSLAVARELAMKQQSRLMKLDPAVARRRLSGMLQRRGFDYDDVRGVIDAVLGARRDDR